MKQIENKHAIRFAERVKGSFTTFLGLSIVLYDYGSSPSLAYWKGRQRRYVKNLNFLSETMRTKHIDEIKKIQTEHLLFRASRRIERKLIKAGTAGMQATLTTI